MGGCSGLVRILLAILNLLLFIAFFAIGIVGLLLRFNKQIILDLLYKVTQHWPSHEVDRLVQLMQNYGSSVAIVLIILGFAVALIALLGVIALFCKVKCVAIIYIIILTILSGIELGLIIYAFAIPNNIYLLTYNFLNLTIKDIVNNNTYSNTSLYFWDMLGSSGVQYCCLLNGLFDANGMDPLGEVPTACCLSNFTDVLNGTAMHNCSYQMAYNYSLYREVAGCKFKVDNWIDTNKGLLVGVPVGLFAFQLLILIIVIVLCVKWGKGYYEEL